MPRDTNADANDRCPKHARRIPARAAATAAQCELSLHCKNVLVHAELFPVTRYSEAGVLDRVLRPCPQIGVGHVGRLEVLRSASAVDAELQIYVALFIAANRDRRIKT
jgi:hypothetical protein